MPGHGAGVSRVARVPRGGGGYGYLDSAGDEVKWALAEIRPVADGVLSLAHDLEVKLPGTSALFRDGLLRHSKVQIIARETALLDQDEARQAEQLILDQARAMSPGALRRAAALAVARVNPAKAKKRREHGARNARVERWREHSGNAGLAGRELPAAPPRPTPVPITRPGRTAHPVLARARPLAQARAPPGMPTGFPPRSRAGTTSPPR